MFHLVTIFALLAVSVMFFFITRVATPDHTYSKIDLIPINKGGSLPAMPPMADVSLSNPSEVSRTNKGMRLPSKGGYPKDNDDWTNGLRNLPRPDPQTWEGRPGHDPEEPRNNEGSGSGHPSQPKPAGTSYRGHPHVVWTGDGHIMPQEGYYWENQKDPGASKYRVLPLPLGTPYRVYLHVVWAGDGQNVMAAEGYKWATNDPIADHYKVVPLTTEEKVWAYGSNATSAVKDKVIRDWIVKVPRKFLNDSRLNDQPSPWADSGCCLIFTESFLTESKATRENLIAFESGKLFFTMMQGKTIKNGKTLEKWFEDFSSLYSSTILDMREAKSKDQNENLVRFIDYVKPEEKFGHIFRAQALQLDKPKDEKALKEWNKALREFQSYVYPLLQGKQKK